MNESEKVSNQLESVQGLEKFTACWATNPQGLFSLEDGSIPWHEWRKTDLRHFWSLCTDETSGLPLTLILGTKTALVMKKVKPTHPRVVIGKTAHLALKEEISKYGYQCYETPQSFLDSNPQTNNYILAAGPTLLTWFLERDLIGTIHRTNIPVYFARDVSNCPSLNFIPSQPKWNLFQNEDLHLENETGGKIWLIAKAETWKIAQKC